jgi:hypothetical protein
VCVAPTRAVLSADRVPSTMRLALSRRNARSPSNSVSARTCQLRQTKAETSSEPCDVFVAKEGLRASSNCHPPENRYRPIAVESRASPRRRSEPSMNWLRCAWMEIGSCKFVSGTGTDQSAVKSLARRNGTMLVRSRNWSSSTKPPEIFRVARKQGRAKYTAGETARERRCAATIDCPVQLHRKSENRREDSGRAQGAGAMIEAGVGHEPRIARGQGEIVADTKSRGTGKSEFAQAERAGTGPRTVADVEKRHLLLHRAQRIDELACVKLTATDIDAADVLPPFATRSIENKADDVEAVGQRHAQELVVSAYRLRLRAAQHFVHIELDLVALG